ncbi:MAG: sensor histidine kinase [Ginsengibacter sp.]
MNRISTAIEKHKILQIILLFMIFHIFWLGFYFLSDAVFIRNGLVHIYVKFVVINSVGFAAFCYSAFLLFFHTIPKRKYFLLIIATIVIVVGLGYLQLVLQDWSPEPFTLKSGTASAAQSVLPVPMQKMKQASGAYFRSMLNILVYVLLGIGYAYMKDWFIKDRRAQILEKEKTKAELALLRYQLNPHFLFNTINDIYYLAIIKSDKTADAILKVSDLLRYVLDHKSEKVLLEKEIDHLKHFLELQQFRFPDQIVKVKLEIKEDISNYEIAPLLLSTFAENAFKHGEPGTEEIPVEITISVKQGVLKYTVVNKVNRQMDKDETTGIGLNNLRKRVSLLYKGKSNLNIEEKGEFFYANFELQL